MKKYLFIALCILLLQSVYAQRVGNEKTKVVDLAEAFNNQHEVMISNFVNKINYVPLETNSEDVIGGLVYYEVTERYIIVRQVKYDRKSQILLFDRNSGKYLGEIGKEGRGPGEYMMIKEIPFNKIKNEIYTQNDSRYIMSYDLSGANIGRINAGMPKLIGRADSVIDLSKSWINFSNMLDENTFAGYVLNQSGSDKRKIVLLTKEGVVKIIPNNSTWDKPGSVWPGVPGGAGKFYRWDNKLYFIEAFCDTLYQVTKDRLIPRYFFSWGNYNAPYSLQGEIGRTIQQINRYFFISKINENKNYIFFKVLFDGKNYIGYVYKKTGIATFCKVGNSGLSILKDDLNNLMDISPENFTQENEMIYIIQPANLVNWIKSNPEKAEQARIKLPWLNAINELSNPIIAIAKCKD